MGSASAVTLRERGCSVSSAGVALRDRGCSATGSSTSINVPPKQPSGTHSSNSWPSGAAMSMLSPGSSPSGTVTERSIRSREHFDPKQVVTRSGPSARSPGTRCAGWIAAVLRDGPNEHGCHPCCQPLPTPCTAHWSSTRRSSRRGTPKPPLQSSLRRSEWPRAAPQQSQSATLGSAPARLMYLLRAIGGSGQLVTLSLVRGRPSGRPAAASGARASHLQIADVSACDHLGPELAGRQLDACLQSNQLVCAAHAARALLRHAPADHPELCTFLGSARAFGASAAALRWCPPG